jgi:hypothetical protein
MTSPVVRSPASPVCPIDDPENARTSSPLRAAFLDAAWWWRRHVVARAWYDARLALGRRMHACGIDDGSLVSTISAVDRQIREGGPAVFLQELENQRTRLLVRLADLALAEEAPLPGAAAEYQAARKVQEALQPAAEGGRQGEG